MAIAIPAGLTRDIWVQVTAAKGMMEWEQVALWRFAEPLVTPQEIAGARRSRRRVVIPPDMVAVAYRYAQELREARQALFSDPEELEGYNNGVRNEVRLVRYTGPSPTSSKRPRELTDKDRG